MRKNHQRLRWRWVRLRWARFWQLVSRQVYRRLYRDRHRDAARAVLLAGSGRSGTTWLGEVLRSQSACRVLFEPFHSRWVKGFGAFHYFQYMRPEDDDPELLTYCRRVFTGEVRHRFVDREVDVLRPDRRLVKEIRANLFLAWIRRRFPEMPMVLLVRHPCAVVLSRMELGWDDDGDLLPCLAQPKLVEDFLAPHLETIEDASTPEEKHAAVWCIHHLVPLAQLPDDVPVVFYEHLLTRPEEEVPRVFEAVGWSFQPAVFEMLERPSRTSSRTSAAVAGGDRLRRWQRRLEPGQIRSVLGVVERFGLGHLYGDSPMPREVHPSPARLRPRRL